MADYRKQWREGIAAQPKYDVFVAYREKDEDLAKHLFDVFNQHGITYSTPADEEQAKKESLRALRPTPVRDSYFFLLLDEPGTIDDNVIQGLLYHAALLNKKPIVVKGQSGASYPDFIWNEETKQDVFRGVAQYILKKDREEEWIYGKRRA